MRGRQDPQEQLPGQRHRRRHGLLLLGRPGGYDTPSTIAGKMTYKKQQGLGGTFFWELSGDTANGALISAIDAND